MNISSEYNFLIRFHSSFSSVSGWRSEIKYCNICGEDTNMAPFSIRFRPGAMCMQCKSLERHRVLFSVLEKHNFSYEGRELLYFSPDLCLENLFREKCKSVQTCDYGGGRHVDLDIDMTNIKLKNNSYDIVIAIHVLEHIVEDMKALKEVLRILKPGGQFLVMIPQNKHKATTVEDKLYTPISKYLKYGGHDHVRVYGLDFTKRAKEAGFKVQVFGNKLFENKMYHDQYNYLEESDHIYILSK